MFGLHELLIKEVTKKALKKKIVGQDEAIDTFLEGIVENLFKVLEAISSENSKSSDRLSNFLISGPTGSGKTLIVKEVCNLFRIPFVEIDVSNVTPAGYRGEELKEIFKKRIRTVTAVPSETVNKYKIFKELFYFYKNKNKKFLVELLKFSSLWVLFPKDYVLNSLDLSNADKEKFKETVKLLESFKNEKPSNNKEYHEKLVVIFLDEFDKLFSNDPQINAFYSKVQEQLLKILEDRTVFENFISARSPIYPIFVLAGSFWNSSLENVIPEMQGRVDYEIKLKKLEKEHYKIIAKQKMPPEFFSKLSLGFLKVEIDESFYDAISEICDRLNARNYLGARRINKIIKFVEEAVLNEFLHSSENVIYLNDSFVRLIFNDNFTFYTKHLADSIAENSIDEASFKAYCHELYFDITYQTLLNTVKKNKNRLFISNEETLEKFFLLDTKKKPLIYKILEEIGLNEKIHLVVNNGKLKNKLIAKLNDFQAKFHCLFKNSIIVEEDKDFYWCNEWQEEVEKEIELYDVEDFLLDE